MLRKKLLIALVGMSMLSTMAIATQYSMSDADRAMYEELKENNPADMDVAYGSELIGGAVGGVAGLAKFFGVEQKELPKHIATFPRYMEEAGIVVGLDQALQLAMSKNGKKPYKLSSNDMVALSAYVKSLANGQNVNVDKDANPYMQQAYELGKYMWFTKRGQRGLSCAVCHELAPDGAANMILRTQKLPQVSDPSANPAGTWPAYRMEKSQLVTLQGRFSQCMNNSLQAKIPMGSPEMVGLEVYISTINKGMSIQVPGLKR